MPAEQRSARRGEDDQGVVQEFLLRDLGHQRADFDIERGGGGRHAPQVGQQVRPQHLLAARRISGRRLLCEGVEFGLCVGACIRQDGIGGEAGSQEKWFGGALRVEERRRLGTARGGAARVPDAAQQLFQRDLAGILELHGGAAGEQGGARLAGHGGAGVVVDEARAGLRQSVDIRRADLRVAVAAQYPGGQAVHQDQQDVGLLTQRLLGGERGQRKAAKEKMTAR